jgi:hypothetical protein
MTTLLVLTVLYFLPTIIGHNKRDSFAIFLLNLFLGWTFIGWIIALVWACSAEPRPHMLVFAGPAGVRYCCACGALSYPGARFCTHCGRAV